MGRWIGRYVQDASAREIEQEERAGGRGVGEEDSVADEAARKWVGGNDLLGIAELKIY